MDFWDVAKLMWRRWHVTVPMLLLTAAAAAVTSLNVSADYQVTDHFAMVRSTVPVDEEELGRPVNPWSSEALAEAAAIRLAGRALAEEMEAAGYQGSWTLNVTGSQPWLQLEVVAKSPEQAQATGVRLREIIEEEVRSRQEEHNIPPEEQITTVRFDEGETVETITRALRQALVAVVGAGLLATMGVVLIYDVIARRRQPRSATMVRAGEPPAAYSFIARVPAAAGATVSGTHPAAGNSAHWRNGSAESTTGADREPARTGASALRPDGSTPPAAAQPPSAAAPAQAGEDATVVLPVAGTPRAGWRPDRRDSNGDRNRLH